MTAFVAIPNGDLDPESPLTTSLCVAGMRDNLQATTEGNNPNKINFTAFDYVGAAGDIGVFIDSTLVSGASASYTKIYEVDYTFSGGVRVTFTLNAPSAGTAYARIYVNGSPVGTERSVVNGGSDTEFTEDLTSISSRDLIQIYIKTVIGATSEVRDIKLSINSHPLMPGRTLP